MIGLLASRAEEPGVARRLLKKIWILKKKKFFLIWKKILFFSLCYPRVPMGFLKKFSPYCLVIWPTIDSRYVYINIYMGEELYYVDK